ncbi:MAG: ATP-binding protein [Minicystis sp.]
MILPIMLVLLGGGWLVWQAGHLSQANDWARQSEQVIDQANLVQKLLLDRETALHAFSITGEASFLEPYEAAHPREALQTLAKQVADNAQQVALVRALQVELGEWDEDAARALADPATARRLEEMKERERHMHRMRALLADFMQIQGEKRAADYARVTREVHIAAGSAIALLAVLGGGAALVSLRQIRCIGAAVARERAALRARDEFIATLSHELRTPLTSILGWAQLGRQKQLSEEALQRALACIERNALAEAQLIDDVLDTARITSGKLTLATEIVDPGAVVHEAIEVVRLSAEARGVILDVAVAPGTPEVIGDPPRLRQVMWNLLSNAVKFTPGGRHVRVSVDRAGSKVRIGVADEGEGITAGMLPHVFDRFWQADSSPTRRHGGLGLGLAIVKDLVALHGGEVRAASDGPGKGAVFTVTLPVAAVRPAGAAAGIEGQPAACGDGEIRGVRVLVVDDDPSTREVIAAALRACGAEVETAESMPAALTALARREVDVLVSDIGMPEASGYDLIGALRRSPRWQRLPALALTAYGGAENVQKALRAGFQAHVAKPVSPAHLVHLVARLHGSVAAFC